MKREYQKPTLTKREALSKVTAGGPTSGPTNGSASNGVIND